MRILNDNSYLKVWIDGHSPILFVQLKSDFFNLVDALEVYTTMNIKPMKSMASTHKDLYLLLDLSDTQCNEIEKLTQYFAQTLTKRIKASFRYMGIVKSKGHQGLHVNKNSDIPVGVFDTFFDALGTINNMRAKECILD